jgi:hypothetical protein
MKGATLGRFFRGGFQDSPLALLTGSDDYLGASFFRGGYQLFRIAPRKFSSTMSTSPPPPQQSAFLC